MDPAHSASAPTSMAKHALLLTACVVCSSTLVASAAEPVCLSEEGCELSSPGTIEPQYAGHLATLRQVLLAEGVDCLLVTQATVFFWLTGGRTYVPLIEESGPSKLFIDQDRAVVVTTTIEEHKMRYQECPGWEVRAAPWAGLPGSIDAIVEELAAGRTVDKDTGRLEEKLTEAMADMNEQDVEAYRALGRDFGAALAEAAHAVSQGDSEYKVAGITAQAFMSRGIDLVMIAVAHDERTALDRHPLPRVHGDTALRQVCLIATCGRRKGLIVSGSRLVAFAPPPVELVTIHKACMEVDAQINMDTIPGKTAGELYDSLTEAYTVRGFPEQMLQHHQGGEIGYKCRHWIAQPGGKQVVKAGRVYAWNPTIAGQGVGTKSEDTIYVNKDGGIEVLTESPDWPMVQVTLPDGRQMMRPDILVRSP